METEQEDFLISKTFVFQNQSNSASENLDVTLRFDQEYINIGQIVDIFKHKNAIHKTLITKIYDPQINHYVIFDSSKPISKSLVYSPVIMIKYKEIQHDFDSDKESVVSSKASSETKRERNRERTVREVLQCVKQWRQIHNTLDRHKNKVNLQQAAKMVGISKKSLDDYFCQLRLAEQYGFKFQINMEEKIGVLRSFVKKFRPKGELGIKHEKLPKKLRIIQQMGTQSTKSRKNSQQKISVDLQASQSLMQAEYEPPMAIIPEDQYQNRFYNSFNFTLQQFDDPFMTFNNNQSPKNYDSQPQYLLF